MGILSKIFGESEEQKNARLEKGLIIKKAEEKFNEFYDQVGDQPIFTRTGKINRNITANRYRIIWRRAVVRHAIFEKLENKFECQVYEELANIAEKRYSIKAPINKYGKVELGLSENQGIKLWKQEMKLLFPGKEMLPQKDYSCIYLGVDNKENKPYIGQTVNEPEIRQLQHRKSKTGPYKNGATYVEWKILRENVALNELDYWESKFIGAYNSFENGHNDNKGNNSLAYLEGLNEKKAYPHTTNITD